MANQDRNSTHNEGHDGYIWSQRKRIAYAVLLALALAATTLSPVLAAGYPGFGK